MSDTASQLAARLLDASRKREEAWRKVDRARAEASNAEREWEKATQAYAKAIGYPT